MVRVRLLDHGTRSPAPLSAPPGLPACWGRPSWARWRRCRWEEVQTALGMPRTRGASGLRPTRGADRGAPSLSLSGHQPPHSRDPRPPACGSSSSSCASLVPLALAPLALERGARRRSSAGHVDAQADDATPRLRRLCQPRCRSPAAAPSTPQAPPRDRSPRDRCPRDRSPRDRCPHALSWRVPCSCCCCP